MTKPGWNPSFLTSAPVFLVTYFWIGFNGIFHFCPEYGGQFLKEYMLLLGI